LQIVETLEGPICISPCLDGEPCQRQETCMSSPVWNELQTRLVDYLSGERLSALAAQPAGIPMPELVQVSTGQKK
jgi:DNA-binding IscR family transcriptional regulator